MISNEEVGDILADHAALNKKRQGDWDNRIAMYDMDFWKLRRVDDIERTDNSVSDTELPMKVELGHLPAWASSYVDSLFHDGIRVSVRDSEIIEHGKMSANAAPACEKLFNYWLRTTDIEDITEHGFLMGLMFEEVGWRVVETDGDNPADRIQLECIPPWALVYDREARNLRSMRYCGHVYDMAEHEVATEFDLSPEQLDALKPAARMKETDPRGTTAADNRDEHYIRVLNIVDYTGKYVHKADSDDPKEEHGVMRWYILEQDEKLFKDPVKTTPAPLHSPSGMPIGNILPMVLNPLPGTPLQGTAPCKSAYLLNELDNMMSTLLVNSAHRDYSRSYAYDKNRLEEDELAKMTSGSDSMLVGVEGPPNNVVVPLPQQPVANSIAQTLDRVERYRSQTAGTNPMSRGQALNYATAAEVESLNGYTETTLGRIRKNVDRTIVRLLRVVQAIMHSGMKKESVTVLLQNKRVKVNPEWLEVPWDVTIADKARTPLAQSQKRQEWIQAFPFLQPLYAEAMQGSIPAQRMVDYVVETFGLPDALRWESIVAEQEAVDKKKAKEEAAAAEAAAAQEAAAAPGGEMPPEASPEDVALAQNPVAQAAIAAQEQQL